MENSLTQRSISNLPSQIITFLMIIMVGWFRHLPLSFPELFNFTPVLALFLFSGSYLKGHLAWSGPIVAVIVSDLILNPGYGVNLLEPFMIITLLSYCVIFLMGKFIFKNKSLLSLMLGSVGCALLFHILTCSFSWFVNPVYTKTLAGFWQAQFLGEPGYAPAYLFLRNSILSTVLFSTIFYIASQKLSEKFSLLSFRKKIYSKV